MCGDRVSNVERMKKEIIEIVDRNWNPWVKAAFYSDPEVEAILSQLYDIWERNDRRGIPLDYATQEQLEILYMKAQEYRDADSYTVAREIIWQGRVRRYRRSTGRRLADKIIECIRRLIVPGQP